MKRRREPVSSHTLARKPGYFESRLSSTSLIVAASTSTVSAPAVNFLNGVGITTLSDMIRTPKNCFKRRQLWLDHLRRREIQRIERFQTITSNGENCEIRLLDPALCDQLLSHRHGHAAGRLRKYAFGLRQQLNARHDFLIRTVFRPSAGFGDQTRSEVAVGGVSDRERLCNRIRFHRANLAAAALDGIDDRIATRCLRAVQPSLRRFADESQALKFLKAFMNLADHRPAGHRHDDGVGRLPAQLFGDFIAYGL